MAAAAAAAAVRSPGNCVHQGPDLAGGTRPPSQVWVKHKSQFLCGDSTSLQLRTQQQQHNNNNNQGRDEDSAQARPVVHARLFGPALFEASKLRVLFLGGHNSNPAEDSTGTPQQQPEHQQLLPRIYTLTHSDITAKLTLAISREINRAQLSGWYSAFQRDEVVAEWKRVKGHMALHVHCHISGGNLYHNLIARFRAYIFRRELPVVLEAFIYGDRELFQAQPELLQRSLVWVYFHSNVRQYNRLECWGPLVEAAKPHLAWATEAIHKAVTEGASMLAESAGPSAAAAAAWPRQLRPRSVCAYPCECCSRHGSAIPLPDSFAMLGDEQQSWPQS